MNQYSTVPYGRLPFLLCSSLFLHRILFCVEWSVARERLCDNFCAGGDCALHLELDPSHEDRMV